MSLKEIQNFFYFWMVSDGDANLSDFNCAVTHICILETTKKRKSTMQLRRNRNFNLRFNFFRYRSYLTKLTPRINSGLLFLFLILRTHRRGTLRTLIMSLASVRTVYSSIAGTIRESRPRWAQRGRNESDKNESPFSPAWVSPGSWMGPREFSFPHSEYCFYAIIFVYAADSLQYMVYRDVNWKTD